MHPLSSRFPRTLPQTTPLADKPLTRAAGPRAFPDLPPARLVSMHRLIDASAAAPRNPPGQFQNWEASLVHTERDSLNSCSAAGPRVIYKTATLPGALQCDGAGRAFRTDPALSRDRSPAACSRMRGGKSRLIDTFAAVAAHVRAPPRSRESPNAAF